MLTRNQLEDIVRNANHIYPNIFGDDVENNFDELFQEYLQRINALIEILDNFKRGKCIKYLGIGEAPTSWNTTYFYSPVALVRTSWFDVPLYHFSPIRHPFLDARNLANKINAIDCITNAGYVFVDISPLPFVGIVNRGTRRFRKLIEFLFCEYFAVHILPLVCPILCYKARTILIGTLSTDRIVYDIVNKGIPCNTLCPNLVLKEAGMVVDYPNRRYTLSSSCATNGPINVLFAAAAL